MKAEYLFARLLPRGTSALSAGRSTRMPDNLALYIARIPPAPGAYAQIVYMQEITPRALDACCKGVLLDVSGRWKQIGRQPKEVAQYRTWRKKQTGVIRRLTELALAERCGTRMSALQRARWLGVRHQTWQEIYAARYRLIVDVLDEYDHQVRRIVNRNQECFS